MYSFRQHGHCGGTSLPNFACVAAINKPSREQLALVTGAHAVVGAGAGAGVGAVGVELVGAASSPTAATAAADSSAFGSTSFGDPTVRTRATIIPARTKEPRAPNIILVFVVGPVEGPAEGAALTGAFAGTSAGGHQEGTEAGAPMSTRTNAELVVKYSLVYSHVINMGVAEENAPNHPILPRREMRKVTRPYHAESADIR